MKLQRIMKNVFYVVLFQFFCMNGQEITNAQLFEGKRILITGGTGFLGRAIALQVLQYHPKEVIMYSRDEVKHFYALTLLHNDPRVRSVIGDIRDYNYLLEQTKDVDIVFHTAALKRIDMLEDNAEEAVKTNVMGTLNLFHACCINKVKKVVLISTDKACSPVNVYGAAKFIGEKIFTNYDRKNISTNFIVVRFGNILESTGSIVPVFADRMKKDGVITLTDSRMTRFIAGKQEAVETIFDALRYGVGGEIFVKKLSSLRITDLIDVLKNKYNYQRDIPVTGIRPGEKLHEELVNFAEISRTFDFGNYYVITPTIKGWASFLETIPAYFRTEMLLDAKSMKGFSSDMALVDKEKIVEIFEKFEVLGEKQWK
jgi:UDP-N-acetylglucosamine 4,6-dehydratase/5-epimerase